LLITSINTDLMNGLYAKAYWEIYEWLDRKKIRSVKTFWQNVSTKK
jgi:hypothetical protein